MNNTSENPLVGIEIKKTICEYKLDYKFTEQLRYSNFIGTPKSYYTTTFTIIGNNTLNFTGSFNEKGVNIKGVFFQNRICFKYNDMIFMGENVGNFIKGKICGQNNKYSFVGSFEMKLIKSTPHKG